MGMPDFSRATDAVGNDRFKADKRLIAGMLFAISITVTFFPLARVAPLINRDGQTVDEGTPLSALIGNLVAMVMGLLGMTVGFLSLTQDRSSPRLTSFLVVFEQLALIPYVTDIVNIGQLADTGNAFIPASYGPSKGDVWFVGAMGMIGAGTFCLFLFGSLAFLAMTHLAYQNGQPESRNGAYYRSRLSFYSGVMALAGLAQLMLGSYIIKNFGNGPLPAPIGVAMFMVHFPEISVTVGLLYLLNGLYGVFRGFTKANDDNFQMSMYVQYLCTLILMICVQTWYAPGGLMAQASPTIANLTLGVHVMPAFLDYMGRNVPDEITPEYYEIGEQQEEQKQPEEAQKEKDVEAGDGKGNNEASDEASETGQMAA